jgi:subtilisin family serine protease
MNFEKLSPTLASAVSDFQEEGRYGLPRHSGTIGTTNVEPGIKPARVVVFVHCDGGLRADAFRDLGVELNQPEGSLRTGIVPFDALDRLTDDPAVHRIVPARRLEPLMDVAKEKVGVNAFRTSSGLTGKGVIFGAVDSGIDNTNTHFTRRILRIWDQTMPGDGVPEGPYGAELKGRQLRNSRDTFGHGTHVAGIAAGGDENFLGVAPKADIIMVKSDLLTAHIADGVRYVFRVARELGRPAVVNLSLGGHGDAHDGTDSLSQIIDQESGAGRIVCCAAGNDGNDNIHAQVVVRKGSTRTIAVTIPRGVGGQGTPMATFNGWYPGRDTLEVSVVPPEGGQTPWQPVITGGSPSRTYRNPFGVVRVITPGPDPANRDHNFFVQIQPAANPPVTLKPDSWRIRLRGQRVTRGGRVDVWVVDRGGAFTGRAVQDAVKVGAPGAASTAITVAAYTTRSEWQDFFGNPHESGLDLDAVSDFSSEGPRRDGAEKPDVAAPGAMIVSAMSAHAPTPPDLMIDDMNRANAGTSMACPFVAGVVALLLERDPGLDPAKAKDLLRKISSIPGKRPGMFDRKWGYGLINAAGL